MSINSSKKLAYKRNFVKLHKKGRLICVFYDNLKNVCSEQGVAISKAVVEAGGKIGSIDGWKKGAYPSSKILEQLSLRLNVSADRLLFGEEKCSLPLITPNGKELSSEEKELLEYFSVLPRDTRQKLLGRAELLAEQAKAQPEEQEEAVILIRHSLYMVSAGTGFELDEGDSWDEIAVPDTRKARKADFCVTVSGDSMEPSFSNGDVVLVKRTPAVDVGQIGIFRIGQKGYIKEYGGDRLISLNPKYDDILFADYDLEDISCCGLVLGIAKEEE